MEVGRPADLVVTARHDRDAYESVCVSIPGDVELVMIGGDVVYGRHDWVNTLVGGTESGDNPAALGYEKVLAWGRRMLLDTGYEVNPDEEAVPQLAEIREALTTIYPPVGPIWA